MENNDVGKGTGLLTGLAIAAFAQAHRWDIDTSRRLREANQDARDATRSINDLRNRGEMIRSRLPVVQDFQVGLSIATPREVFPDVIPSAPPVVRPDLASSAEAAILESSWPPSKGDYDDTGRVTQAGELASLGLAMTFEEVRAGLLGLVQGKQPTYAQKRQIYRCLHALNEVLYGGPSSSPLSSDGLGLAYADYVAAWRRLFTGSAEQQQDPHRNTATPPIVLSKDAGLVSVQPLGMPDINYPYEHQNTDAAFKLRMQVGGAIVNSGTTLFTIQFGTPYTRNGKPYVPVVLATPTPPIQPMIGNVTPTGFQVFNFNSAPAASVLDLAFAVVS